MTSILSETFEKVWYTGLVTLTSFNRNRIDKLQAMTGKGFSVSIPCCSAQYRKDGARILWNQNTKKIDGHLYATNSSGDYIVRDSMDAVGVSRTISGRKINIRVAARRAIDPQASDRFLIGHMECGDDDCVNPEHMNPSLDLGDRYSMGRCPCGRLLRGVRIDIDGAVMCTVCYRNGKYTPPTNNATRSGVAPSIRKMDLVWEHLLDNPCPCGETDPVVLEFDHIDPSTKLHTISAMINGTYSYSDLVVEISKCQVLCANCHRRKTAKDKNWWKLKRKVGLEG